MRIFGLFMCCINFITGFGVKFDYSTGTLLKVRTPETHVYIPRYIRGIKVRTIGSYAFSRRNNMLHVQLPSSIELIGRGAFQKCSSLTHLRIPTNVCLIEENAFEECWSLTAIWSSSSTYHSGNDGVLYCDGGRTVFHYPCQHKSSQYYMPDCVTKIGNHAFQDNFRITNIVSEDSLLIRSNYHDTVIVVISPNVKIIGDYAFAYLENLVQLDIPDGVESIGSNAFNRLRALTVLKLPPSLLRIGSKAFERCHSLHRITIPSSVSIIQESAFIGCSGLEVATFGSGVEYIGNNAFSNCTRLSKITLNKGLEVIDFQAFSGCPSLHSVTIPASVVGIDYSSFDCEVSYAKGSVFTPDESALTPK